MTTITNDSLAVHDDMDEIMASGEYLPADMALDVSPVALAHPVMGERDVIDDSEV